MKEDFEIIGKINNWMDLRDKLIETLKKCDNELKFNRFIEGIILSVGGIDTIQETRKKLGIKPLSKKEVKALKEKI